jgi:hypothetical protein
MALDPLTAEQLAAQAAAHLIAVQFGARLGEFTAQALATAAQRVRDAGGDPTALVYRPAAAGLRQVADWLDQGAP